jgi:hypothetical protein
MREKQASRRPLGPLSGTELADVLLSAVWPIVARINGEWHPHGTGFLISPSGLMMTARHVVEPPTRLRGRALDADGNWYDEGQLYAFIPRRKDPRNGQVLPPSLVDIVRLDFTKRGDIALCQLIPGEGQPPPVVIALVLHPGLPRIGESITLFGYDQLDASVLKETPEELAINADSNAILRAAK